MHDQQDMAIITEASRKLTLFDYLGRMRAEQKENYYMTGPDQTSADL